MIKLLVYKIWRKIQIYAYDVFGKDILTGYRIKRCPDLVHIGTRYGGWVIPRAQFDSNSICYCVGCGEDISFDLGLIEMFDCDVYGFDPTPKSIDFVNKVAGNNLKYHFFDVGLWDKKDILAFYTPKDENHVSHSLVNLQKTDHFIEVPVNRLQDIMRQNGHSRLDLLKLDIEGAEYVVLQTILEDGIDIKVICVEYDEAFNPIDDSYKSRIKSSIDGLLANNYSLVCVQGIGNYTFFKQC